MNLQKLKNMCASSNRIMLNMRGRHTTGDRMLFIAGDRKSPLGEFVSEDKHGTMVKFDSDEILQYIEKVEAKQ